MNVSIAIDRVKAAASKKGIVNDFVFFDVAAKQCDITKDRLTQLIKRKDFPKTALDPKGRVSPSQIRAFLIKIQKAQAASKVCRDRQRTNTTGAKPACTKSCKKTSCACKKSACTKAADKKTAKTRPVSLDEVKRRVEQFCAESQKQQAKTSVKKQKTPILTLAQQKLNDDRVAEMRNAKSKPKKAIRSHKSCTSSLMPFRDYEDAFWSAAGKRWDFVTEESFVGTDTHRAVILLVRDALHYGFEKLQEAKK